MEGSKPNKKGDSNLTPNDDSSTFHLGHRKIYFWPNGKRSQDIFGIEISEHIDSLRRLKDQLKYERKLSRYASENMKIYNHKGIEIDDVDIAYLHHEEILYIAYDGAVFSNDNYVNEYEVLKSIKSGGFGEVFLAIHSCRKDQVAIKKTNLDHFTSDALYNISREAMYLSSLRHHNIIKIHSSYLTDQALFIVMDYAKGGELSKVLEKGPILEGECKRIFKQIHEAVKYIHSMNVIHRDLKPNNILFLDEEQGHVVLIDFGISGICNGNMKEVIKAGTIRFVPPEIAENRSYEASPKLDLWALGVILYLMVIGKCPFEGKSQEEIFNKIAHSPLTFPINANISKTLYKLLTGLLQKDPDERLDALSQAFDDWYDDTSDEVMIFRTSPKKQPSSPSKCHRNRRSLIIEPEYLPSLPNFFTQTTSKGNRSSANRENLMPNYLKTTISQKNKKDTKSKMKGFNWEFKKLNKEFN